MDIPWSIIIALAVLAIAYIIKHFAIHIIENDDHFLRILMAFFIIYVGAAITISIINPKINLTNAVYAAGSSDDVSEIAPSWSDRIQDFFRLPLPRS